MERGVFGRCQLGWPRVDGSDVAGRVFRAHAECRRHGDHVRRVDHAARAIAGLRSHDQEIQSMGKLHHIERIEEYEEEALVDGRLDNSCDG